MKCLACGRHTPDEVPYTCECGFRVGRNGWNEYRSLSIMGDKTDDGQFWVIDWQRWSSIKEMDDRLGTAREEEQ